MVIVDDGGVSVGVFIGGVVMLFFFIMEMMGGVVGVGVVLGMVVGGVGVGSGLIFSMGGVGGGVGFFLMMWMVGVGVGLGNMFVMCGGSGCMVVMRMMRLRVIVVFRVVMCIWLGWG